MTLATPNPIHYIAVLASALPVNPSSSIIIFIKRKILSLESVLSAYAHTNSYTHTGTRTHVHTDYTKLNLRTT